MTSLLRIALAVLVIGMLTAGCTSMVDGTPRTVGSSAGIVGIGREVVGVLPDAQDLQAALGTPVDNNGFPPTVGGLSVLPDGIRDSKDASEIQCLGVTFAYTKKVYEKSSVRAAALHDWDNWSQGLDVRGFSVQLGALALTSPSDARTLFNAFTTQWQQCQGKTMVLYHAGGGADQLLEITRVQTTDSMLSAIVMGSSPATHTAASPDERALGIAANCIVDVEVHDSSWRTGDPAPNNLAVKIAQTMLNKVRGTA